MNDGRKKVAFFLPSLGGGGAEMHLLRVLNHASWSTLEPELILARRGGTYEQVLAAGVSRRHLLPGAVRSSTLSLMLAAWPLRRHLRRLRPAVVCSLLHHTTVVMHWALPRTGPRPIFLVGLQNNVSRDLAFKPTPAAQWYQRRILRAFDRADHFAALSRGVAEDFQRRFPRWSERVSVIYNAGFDPSVTERAAERLEETPPTGAKLLVTCGRLTPQKNQTLLLRALAEVRKKIDAHLWILGRGELRSQLEAQARELGVADAVRFLGFQANPFKYLARADVFVLSSDWEGFGNVLVEAMALSVPVISTACPFGPPEIIRSGENGLLVPVGSVESLAGAILALCGDLTLAERLGRAGRRRAEDFHARRIAGEYERLLEDLASGTAGKNRVSQKLPRPAAA